MSAPSYKPFVDDLLTLLTPDTTPSLHHVPFSPFPPTAAFSAPVTEVVTFYFPSSVTTEERGTFDDALKQFLEVMGREAEGFEGHGAGWVEEELQHRSLADKEGETGTGKAFELVVGWQSIEAHMKYRDTEAFAKGIEGLRGASKGVGLFHVAVVEG